MKQTLRLPNNLNLPFVEGLYADYLREPSSVSAEWRRYFEVMENGSVVARRSEPTSGRLEKPRDTVKAEPSSASTAEEEAVAGKQDRVDQLIEAYRARGHMIARINPLGFPRSYPPELDPEFYGLTEAEMDQRFSCETMHCEGP